MIATIIAFFTTLANKLLVDQDEMESSRAEMKEFQEKMKEAQMSGDAKALAKAQAMQKDVMAKQGDMMKNSFKPLLVTLIPIMLMFWWMGQPSNPINHVIVQLPEFVYYVLLVPVWHGVYGMFYGGGGPSVPFIAGWLGWYIMCTFAMTQILRKFMGFKTGF
ncbi:EMC3/TMCO1 family protein [Methanobrevibacter arboriphilus]|uniref:EMC3/TMCO1 family protein n=1 Tax=Methanobrevibacter arboriphilus TaxID=39441 RepID=UPI000AD3A170|nr:EMC3/TMCO1 family protein [Methanobrevibacter arboriphilus]